MSEEKELLRKPKIAEGTTAWRCPRPILSASIRPLCVRSAVLMLTLGLLPAVIAPHQRGLVSAAPAATETEVAADEDDDDTDYEDDGSQALDGAVSRPFSSELTPLSLDEEQGLLGDWGDSSAEAED